MLGQVQSGLPNQPWLETQETNKNRQPKQPTKKGTTMIQEKTPHLKRTWIPFWKPSHFRFWFCFVTHLLSEKQQADFHAPIKNLSL